MSLDREYTSSSKNTGFLVNHPSWVKCLCEKIKSILQGILFVRAERGGEKRVTCLWSVNHTRHKYKEHVYMCYIYINLWVWKGLLRPQQQ